VALKSSENEEFEALSAVIGALRGLAPDVRQRVLAAVSTFLGVYPGREPAIPVSSGVDRATPSTHVSSFSEDRAPSPKDFLFGKRPVTDLERVACLAYYLTHYRSTPHFKTLELSKLNTEAAQLKFSNAANAVENATKAGLLVPAARGSKQLSAIGERYVQALPDREAARGVIADSRPRKRPKKTGRSRYFNRDSGFNPAD
jgi:hypothetical protein